MNNPAKNIRNKLTKRVKNSIYYEIGPKKALKLL